MTKKTPKFHPRAPRRLKKLWNEHPAFYQIAKYLQVNVGYVYNAMMKGKEPINENVRSKFGLPRRPRKPRTVKLDSVPLPDYMRWWKRLDASIREVYIKETYDEWATKSPNG